MPEGLENNVVIAPNEPHETQPVETGADSLGRDLEAMRQAAERFVAESRAETGEPAPAKPRNEKGQFVSHKPAEASENPAPEGVDPVWLEVAKSEGLTDADIATLKSEQDFQNRIALNRVQTMQRLGLDPMELAAFKQWKQSQGQPAETNPQTAAASAQQLLEDLKLEIKEDDLGPEVATPLKAVMEYANKVKATYAAELQKVQAELATFKGELKQSAEARQQAEREARMVQQFDSMVSGVPGFVEHFGGKPSELAVLAQQTNMRDPKVRKLMAWDIEYYQPQLEKYENILGQGNPRAQQLALQAAWKAAGLDKSTPASNGKKNGTATYGPNSVVVSSPRRPPTETVGDDDSIDALYERSRSAVASAWDEAGGNPFRMTH